MVDSSKANWSTTGSEKQSHAAKIFRVKDQWWIAAVASSNINTYNRNQHFLVQRAPQASWPSSMPLHGAAKSVWGFAHAWGHRVVLDDDAAASCRLLVSCGQMGVSLQTSAIVGRRKHTYA